MFGVDEVDEVDEWLLNCWMGMLAEIGERQLIRR
jgi:hypothetical protein